MMDRLRKRDDDWALFPGSAIALACILSATPVLLLGVLRFGDRDNATRDAILAVGVPATGALTLLGLVMLFSIGGRWSPGLWFYAGVLIQGLYISKFFFEPGVAAELAGFASVFASGLCFALDCRRTSLDLAAARTVCEHL